MLAEVEKINEALKTKINQILAETEKIQEEEKNLLEKLEISYGKKFTAAELLEIINEKN